MIRIALPLAALALIGAKAPVDRFAGRVPVDTQRCVDRNDNGPLAVVNDRTLMFDRIGQRVWRNDLPERCSGLSRDDVLIVESYGSELCENDLIRPLVQGTSVPGAACRLGKFTAYEKVK